MPRKTVKKPQLQGSNDGSWRDRTHRVDFSLADEFEIQQWYEGGSHDARDCLWELVDSGWSVKVTPPQSNDDYWVSLGDRRSASETKGHTFTIRYPDMDLAIIIAYYVANVWIEERYLAEGITGNSKGFLNRT